MVEGLGEGPFAFGSERDAASDARAVTAGIAEWRTWLLSLCSGARSSPAAGGYLSPG